MGRLATVGVTAAVSVAVLAVVVRTKNPSFRVFPEVCWHVRMPRPPAHAHIILSFSVSSASRYLYIAKLASIDEQRPMAWTLRAGVGGRVRACQT